MPDLAMIAVYPTALEAEEIAVEGGLAADDLHVTLVFLGEAADVNEAAVTDALAAAAAGMEPLAGMVGGFGHFSDTGDGIPVIALPDVKGLTFLRERVVAELAKRGIESPSEHGFLPHMTLRFAETAELGDRSALGMPLHFDAVSVVIGDRRIDYPLEALSEEASVLDQSVTLQTAYGTFTVAPPDNGDDVLFTTTTAVPDVALPGVPAAEAARILRELVQVTVDTEAPATAEDAEPVRWAGVLALEGIPTDDSTPTPRILLPGSMSWRELPLPLMAMLEDWNSGHDGHKVAGRIDEVWREPRPDLGEGVTAIMGRGVFDTSEFGMEIARLVGEKTLRGISIDPVAVEWALVSSETLEAVDGDTLTAEDMLEGNFYAAMTKATIAAATVCPMQAFGDAAIAILTASATEIHVETAAIWLEDDEPLVACAAGPIYPDASWFENPRFRKLTPPTVAPEGRFFGHVATKDCHVGYQDVCIRVPPSRDGYARFHTGTLKAADGSDIRVGRIQVKPHASRKMSIDEAIAYYSDPATVGAFVRIYDDDFGIAAVGCTRSDAPPELLRDFLANPPSGEWRRGELMGFSCVPLPGLPVAVPEAYLVASADEGEVEMLLMPPVTADDVEIDEFEVRVAAAELEGPAALAELVSAE